ncbi:MAG: aminotransferase class V-fold PLP-dependent enzyme [Pseudomonadota bacterium]
MTIYFDNASTSYPKPQCVYSAVQHALTDIGASPGRGAYRLAREASEIISRTRQKASRLLGISEPERLVFTKNATEGINAALKGWLRPGDRVVLSSLEHNAVVRPLTRLSNEGITRTIINCSSGGLIDIAELKKQLCPPPRLVVLVHASNVNGALQPVEEIAALCTKAGVPLLLDAAQTAGVQPVQAALWNLGMLVCSGHKGLLGPPGVGLLYVRPGLEIHPLIEGGTGSRSEELTQPDFYPDRMESGTLDLPAIAGLEAGMDFISEKGVEAFRDNELCHAGVLEQSLSALDRVRVFSPAVRGTGVVSFTIKGMNPSDVGFILDEAFDIAVRTGLHCAPLAHKTLGTYPEGTVRISPGWFTSSDDIQALMDALKILIRQRLKKPEP